VIARLATRPIWWREGDAVGACRLQLQYFDTVIAWLREQNAAPGGFLNGSLDISKLAVAGHSRGGKLAGLLFAGMPTHMFSHISRFSRVHFAAYAAFAHFSDLRVGHPDSSSRTLPRMVLASASGKDSAMSPAARPEISTAFLVDPVDNTGKL